MSTAWRYFRLAGDKLESPLTQDVLPSDGILRAGCSWRQLALAGACVYRTSEDVKRALDVFDLDPQQFVITRGGAESPLVRDADRQLYIVAGLPRVGPDSYRTMSYTVEEVYLPTPRSLAYDFPVRSVDEL